MATSTDACRIAWYRYGTGDHAVLFIPTWNLVDARVVGHQVAALAPRATYASRVVDNPLDSGERMEI